MTVYTYSETRKKLAEVLRQAQRDGGVLIRRRDGATFTIRPATPSASGSPLDVEGVDGGLSASEIVAFVREGREGYNRED